MYLGVVCVFGIVSVDSCGPEMIGLLCDCGAVCMYGLASSKGGSVFTGLMCCLLCLYL